MSIYSLDGDIIGSGALRGGGGDLVDARGRSGMMPSNMTFDARQARPILADASPRAPRGVALPGTVGTPKPSSDVGTTTRFYRTPGTGTGSQQFSDVLRAGINEAGRVVQGVSAATAPVSSPPPPPPATPWYEAGWVKAAGAAATLLGLYYLLAKKG